MIIEESEDFWDHMEFTYDRVVGTTSENQYNDIIRENIDSLKSNTCPGDGRCLDKKDDMTFNTRYICGNNCQPIKCINHISCKSNYPLWVYKSLEREESFLCHKCEPSYVLYHQTEISLPTERYTHKCSICKDYHSNCIEELHYSKKPFSRFYCLPCYDLSNLQEF
jgi:hypothetical protein